MLAHGAELRRLRALVDVAAVQAHPAAGGIGHIQLLPLQQVRQIAKAVSVGLFNGGDALEGGGDLREALRPGRFGKGGVYRVELLIFIVLGPA